MAALKRIGSVLLLVFAGLGMAILLIEIGLRIVPETSWKQAISRAPSRHILYEQDRNIGWVLRPNASLNWQGTEEYDVDILVNSIGLRDEERTYEKAPGVFRILVLGDSFTEAMQVPLEQSFPARLASCLAGRTPQKIEVINAGVSGYGAGEALLFFNHRGVKFQPDLVLVAIFIGNDIRNMEHLLGSSFLEVTGGFDYWLQNGELQMRWVDWADPYYEIPFQERFLRQHSYLYYILKSPDSKVPHWLEDIKEILSARPAEEVEAEPTAEELTEFTTDPSLMIFIKDFPDNPLLAPNIKQMWDLFAAALGELNDRVKEQDAELAAVIIPRGEQVHDSMYGGWVAKYTGKYKGLRLEDWDLSAPNRATGDFLKKRDVPVLDLLPEFRAYGQTHDNLLYFDHDGHFNEQGHAVTADLMCDWLLETHLVPLTRLTVSGGN